MYKIREFLLSVFYLSFFFGCRKCWNVEVHIIYYSIYIIWVATILLNSTGSYFLLINFDFVMHFFCFPYIALLIILEWCWLCSKIKEDIGIYGTNNINKICVQYWFPHTHGWILGIYWFPLHLTWYKGGWGWIVEIWTWWNLFVYPLKCFQCPY